MMVACGVILPSGGIVFGADANKSGSRAEWFSSTLSMAMSLGGVGQQGHGVGHGLMVSCRMEAQFDIVLALVVRMMKNMRNFGYVVVMAVVACTQGAR
jgi:hypothetical protein